MNKEASTDNHVKVKITQAVLANIVEANTKALEKVDRKLDDHDERLRDAENDITGLKTIFSVWGGLNSLGVAIGAWLGLK